jgi:Sec-independent protein translocase protein TatA
MPDFNILGIGIPEVFFFIVILLLLFGPNDLTRMARQTGRFINRLTRNENFQTVQRVSEEMRNIPQRLVEEARLDELQQVKEQTAAELKAVTQTVQQTSQAASQTIRAAQQEAAEVKPPAPPASDQSFPAWTQDLNGSAAPSTDPFAAWTGDLKSSPPAKPE